MAELQCEPEQFKGRIIFMSMYNDIVRRDRRNTEKWITNSVAVANHARRFLRGRSSFLESGSEKKRYGTYSEKPDGKWDKTAERMMLNFAGSGHPFFMPPASRKEETRRSKGKGRKSFHFNASEETMELVARTILSLNELSIYGAVADLCKKIIKRFRGRRETCIEWRFGINGNTYRTSYCRSSHQRGVAGKPAARLWT